MHENLVFKRAEDTPCVLMPVRGDNLNSPQCAFKRVFCVGL